MSALSHHRPAPSFSHSVRQLSFQHNNLILFAEDKRVGIVANTLFKSCLTSKATKARDGQKDANRYQQMPL
jgi:hypothetical protein